MGFSNFKSFGSQVAISKIVQPPSLPSVSAYYDPLKVTTSDGSIVTAWKNSAGN